MRLLDTEHELSTVPEPAELPEPHHAQWRTWVIAFTIGVVAMFTTTLGIIVWTASYMFALVVAPIILVFVTFITHAVAERDK